MRLATESSNNTGAPKPAVPLSTMGVGLLAVVGLGILGMFVTMEQQALAAVGGDVTLLPWSPTPWVGIVLAAVLLALIAVVELLSLAHEVGHSNDGCHHWEDHRPPNVRVDGTQPAHDPLVPAIS